MSERTPNLQLPYIQSNQAQKHVTHNEAIRNLDALVQISIEDKDLSSPPATPTDGGCYIVAAEATGDWAGNENLIASWQDEAWSFYAPEEGWTAWIKDEDFQMVYDGAQWQSLSSGGGGGSTNLNPATGGLVGVNATADTTNRLSVNSPASLFNHDGDDHQLKISKNSVADNASVIFQTAFSGRAEFGLTGDDDFHMKVSPDGTTFHEGIVIDKDTGQVSFPNTTFSGGVVNSVFGRTGTITAESGDYSFDQIEGVSQNVLLGRVSAGTGAQEALTSTQVRSLLNVEDGATANQTGAEIKTAYEAQSNTNAFTDAEQAKLAAIEVAATADQTDDEIETAYNNQVDQVSSGEITAGTQTDIRRYAPADIKTFIDTHASGSGGSLTDEEVEDIVGAMVSGNNEQRITTAYDDVAGKLDFVVDNDLANYDNSSSSFLSSVSGTDIVLGSDAQGDLIYHNGAAYTRLPAGTNGQFLKTQGAGANPIWETLAGGGDLLSANNLSDLGNAGTARTNLGLGALATLATVDTAQIEDDGITLAKMEHGTPGDILFYDQSGVPTRLAKGSEGQVLTQGTAIPEWEEGAGGSTALLHLQDQKSSGTDGGTFTSGSYRTRDLNTSLVNEITGASLSSNQITLPAGTYDVTAFAVGYDCSYHQARIRNVTDSTTLCIGLTVYANTSNNVSNTAVVAGQFTLAATKDIELQHRCNSTKSSTGFGVAASFGTEVYADIQIRKVG